MTKPVIFEIPKFSPGDIVELKGKLGDIEEHGFDLKINNFVQVLIPLSEADYDQLVQTDDPTLYTLDDLYDNSVRIEIEIDKNGNPIFKSIYVEK